MPRSTIHSRLIKVTLLVVAAMLSGTVRAGAEQVKAPVDRSNPADETAQRKEARKELENARALAGRQKVAEALESARRAVGADASFGQAHSLVGNLLLDASDGNADEALAEFQKAAELSPKDMDARVGTARIKALKGDLEGAVAILEEAAKLNPKPQTVWYRLGVVYERAGKYEKAVDVFRRALAKMLVD